MSGHYTFKFYNPKENKFVFVKTEYYFIKDYPRIGNLNKSAYSIDKETKINKTHSIFKGTELKKICETMFKNGFTNNSSTHQELYNILMNELYIFYLNKVIEEKDRELEEKDNFFPPFIFF